MLTVAITFSNLISIFSGQILISDLIKNISHKNLIILLIKVTSLIIIFLNIPMLVFSSFQFYQSTSGIANIFISIFSILNFIFIIGLVYFIEAYSIEIKYQENPSLLKLSNKRYGLFKVLKLLISNLSIFFQGYSAKFYIILLIILLIIYIK